MTIAILFLVISFIAIVIMIACKFYGVDTKSVRYISFRARADRKIVFIAKLVRNEFKHFVVGIEHVIKKSAPLFFAHVASIAAAYFLKKSSTIVDMVKGRHVIDHGGTVSPFLDQVAGYKNLENPPREG